MTISVELDGAMGMWRITVGHYLYWSETRAEAELLVIVLNSYKWN